MAPLSTNASALVLSLSQALTPAPSTTNQALDDLRISSTTTASSEMRAASLVRDKLVTSEPPEPLAEPYKTQIQEAAKDAQEAIDALSNTLEAGRLADNLRSIVSRVRYGADEWQKPEQFDTETEQLIQQFQIDLGNSSPEQLGKLLPELANSLRTTASHESSVNIDTGTGRQPTPSDEPVDRQRLIVKDVLSGRELRRVVTDIAYAVRDRVAEIGAERLAAANPNLDMNALLNVIEERRNGIVETSVSQAFKNAVALVYAASLSPSDSLKNVPAITRQVNEEYFSMVAKATPQQRLALMTALEEQQAAIGTRYKMLGAKMEELEQKKKKGELNEDVEQDLQEVKAEAKLLSQVKDIIAATLAVQEKSNKSK